MHSRFFQIVVVFVGSCVGLMTLSGCGADKVAKVSGKVTFNGKAMSGGTIVFAPEDEKQPPKIVTIGLDGNYSSNEVPWGKLRVGVSPAAKSMESFAPKDKFKIPQGPSGPSGSSAYSSESRGVYVDIPQDLRDPTKSKKTVTVDSAEKTYDIELP